MKTKFYITTSLGILAMIIIVACQANREEERKTKDKIPVKVTQAVSHEVSFPIRGSGPLASKKEIKLSFKTGGIIEKIYVEEGQRVKKDQILASLNLSEIEAQEQQAMLGVDKAERDLERAENLYKDSVATLEQFQNARTALKLAQSQLKIIQFNKEYSLISAPTEGKILKRLAESGEMIAPGYPLFLFASTESDYVLRIALADVSLVRIRVGDPATVSFDAYPGREFKAEVVEIATSSDPYTGTYEVELRMLGAQTNFVSGLIGTTNIYPRRKEEYLSLPVRAIHEAEAETGYVYIATDTSYYKKRVSITAITDSLIYFDANLRGDEQIILEGAEYLNPNFGIEIVE